MVATDINPIIANLSIRPVVYRDVKTGNPQEAINIIKIGKNQQINFRL